MKQHAFEGTTDQEVTQRFAEGTLSPRHRAEVLRCAEKDLHLFCELMLAIARRELRKENNLGGRLEELTRKLQSHAQLTDKDVEEISSLLSGAQGCIDLALTIFVRCTKAQWGTALKGSPSRKPLASEVLIENKR